MGPLLTLSWLIHTAMAMNKISPPEVRGYTGFTRECSRGEQDCHFTSENVDNTIYFDCRAATSDANKKYCFCATGSPPKDEVMFPTEWDEGKCFVRSKGAPCGTHNGLLVTCKGDTGLDCIQGRCRKPNDLHSVDAGGFCSDDLDCKDLSCMKSKTPTAVQVKRCYASE